MDNQAHLASSLTNFADQLTAGNQRMKELFDTQDEQLASAYELACIADTDQKSEEAWQYVTALQQEHSKKLDTIARWLEQGNEEVLSVYFDSLKS